MQQNSALAIALFVAQIIAEEGIDLSAKPRPPSTGVEEDQTEEAERPPSPDREAQSRAA